MRWVVVVALAVMLMGSLTWAEDGSVSWPPEESLHFEDILQILDEEPTMLRILPFGCRVQTHYPHLSRHVPGKINVIATVECELIIPQLYIETQLYRCRFAIGNFCLH